MKNQEKDQSEAKELRQKAENELVIRKSSILNVEADNLKLVHELQVHQIELEMQNDELTKAREHAEATMEKYTDLYDFAPSGYLTLSEEGEITDLNFSAATMLGKDRIQLKSKQFGLFIAPESLDIFNEFFNNIYRFREKQSCELLLKSSSDTPCYIHVDALVSQITSACLITMIDISELKKTEIELQKALHQYKELNRYFMDRELRMLDLKKEINELLLKSGCEQEYLI
jgi:PAS domain S-box-containing protein